MIIATAKSASRPLLSREMPLMLSPEVFGIGPAMPQPSIDVGQRLLRQKSDYPCMCQVADRHRAYTHVQFFRRIGVQTLLGDNC